VPDSEDTKHRLDRELIELLNELRIALPGVQVLFAFLLTIPFSQRFARLSSADEHVFFAGFLLATLATATLIAPTAYHRLRWRERDKEKLLEISNRLAIVGLGLLAGAMICVIYVVTDLLFGTAAGITIAVLGALTFGGLWYALPLARKSADRRNA
jgi:hypothetical protein